MEIKQSTPVHVVDASILTTRRRRAILGTKLFGFLPDGMTHKLFHHREELKFDTRTRLLIKLKPGQDAVIRDGSGAVVQKRDAGEGNVPVSFAVVINPGRYKVTVA